MARRDGQTAAQEPGRAPGADRFDRRHLRLARRRSLSSGSTAAFSSSPGSAMPPARRRRLALSAHWRSSSMKCGAYLALKNVEANQRRLAPLDGRPSGQPMRRHAIREVHRGDSEGSRRARRRSRRFSARCSAITRPAQQLELLNQTVMSPLDRRAEAIVRRGATRAFGITAISPTAITDALFFVADQRAHGARDRRLLRPPALGFGHRASARAAGLRSRQTWRRRLCRRDADASISAARSPSALATSAAESVYARPANGAARLVTMGLCRPIPFRPNELPGILSSLIGNLFAKPAQERRADKPDADTN